MANIYDVAKRARVSVATVSAVLNDSAFVSAGLQTRVRFAVDALGYEPNLLARIVHTRTGGMHMLPAPLNGLTGALHRWTGALQ